MSSVQTRDYCPPAPGRWRRVMQAARAIIRWARPDYAPVRDILQDEAPEG